jgi:hypothetical protein
MVTIRCRHGKGLVLQRPSAEFSQPLDMSDGDAQYVSERTGYLQPATWLGFNVFQGGGAS